MKNLPEIRFSDHHGTDSFDDALAALIEANDPPTIFVKGTRLVRVHPGGWVESLSYKALRCVLSSSAIWICTVKKEPIMVPFAPWVAVQKFFHAGSWPGIPAFKEDRDQ